eukprot:Skav212257  [mRNA]  locus=scaffold499:242007:243637:- [translate_table: standard]
MGNATGARGDAATACAMAGQLEEREKQEAAQSDLRFACPGIDAPYPPMRFIVETAVSTEDWTFVLKQGQFDIEIQHFRHVVLACS